MFQESYYALSHSPFGLFFLKVKNHNLLNFGENMVKISRRKVSDIWRIKVYSFLCCFVRLFFFFDLKYYV